MNRFAERSKQPLENTMAKKRKLRWIGHASRSSGLAKTILQGTVNGKGRRGGQNKWEDNIKEWTGMDYGNWRQNKMETGCCEVICGAPTTMQGYELLIFGE